MKRRIITSMAALVALGVSATALTSCTAGDGDQEGGAPTEIVAKRAK